MKKNNNWVKEQIDYNKQLDDEQLTDVELAERSIREMQEFIESMKPKSKEKQDPKI